MPALLRGPGPARQVGVGAGAGPSRMVSPVLGSASSRVPSSAQRRGVGAALSRWGAAPQMQRRWNTPLQRPAWGDARKEAAAAGGCLGGREQTGEGLGEKPGGGARAGRSPGFKGQGGSGCSGTAGPRPAPRELPTLRREKRSV
ncbi:ribosome recycling factor [Platysternon megacephalum]|uniref:Ribosome recycling factor n=1 Tax=Platysternon megacephalum TaxID=55544 RepID=A0A4D9DL34_9SAUR|nr:ribosome recycling factor [Platysternon megacephalum]